MVLRQFSMSIQCVFVTTAIVANGVLPSATNAQVLTASDAFIVAPHATHEGGVFTGDTIAAAFSILTNGVVEHGGGGPLIDNVDTWMHDNFGRNHFVGLKYATANRFDEITVELGNQFGDGGDWQATPKLYILKNPKLVGSTVRPEYYPSSIWTEVTGHAEVTGHVFDPIVVPGAGGSMIFDLSAIPAADRTGYGWALGGVPGNHRVSDGLWNFLSFTEAYATGAAATAPVVPTPTTPQPVNIVSNAYHVPVLGGDGYTDIRGAAFEVITNGIVDHGGAGHADGYDTFQGDNVGETDFVGLQYNTQVKFDKITIELGNQFGDGGDWEAVPKVYILKNPVDTDMTRPELDPTNWTEVPATEVGGHVFDPAVVPGAGGTIVLDLSSASVAARTGWGFAVGGVDGNQRTSDNLWNFISISEVSIVGSVVVAHPGDFDSDGDVDGADFVAWQTNFPKPTGATLAQGDADGDGDVDGADFVVWQTNFPFSPGPGASPVPEPAAAFLAVISAVAMFGIARRRK
jgi:hypothetical protein